jgi:hypothetical protein
MAAYVFTELHDSTYRRVYTSFLRSAFHLVAREMPPKPKAPDMPDITQPAVYREFSAERSYTREHVRPAVAAGKTVARLHVLDMDAAPAYLRNEVQHVYPDNIAAGEEVRIKPVFPGSQWPEDIPRRDMLLLDADTVIWYEHEGHDFIEGTISTDPADLTKAYQVRDAALTESYSYTEFIKGMKIAQAVGYTQWPG